MSETGAGIGYGSIFAIGNGASPETFAALAEVTSITPPSDSIDVIDATHMQSPDATREFILGLNDPGECSMEINFIPGGPADDTLQSVRNARVPVNCKITFPNNIIWAFRAILTGYEPDVPVDDKMTATVTFKVTGSYNTGAVSA